jgi:hypothetical protein
MKTWIKIFRCEFFGDVENTVNEYCRKRNLTPLSISMTTNHGIVFVAVVVTKSEDTE